MATDVAQQPVDFGKLCGDLEIQELERTMTTNMSPSQQPGKSQIHQEDSTCQHGNHAIPAKTSSTHSKTCCLLDESGSLQVAATVAEIAVAHLALNFMMSPSGIASPQVYGQLLGIYLLQNELCHAKLLWKRIPQSLKNANPELGQIWAVGQKLWQQDFPGTYEVLKKDWTEAYKPIMTAVLECTRRGAVNLIGQAYSSIKADEFAAFVGLPVNDALQAATAEGWLADPQTRIVTPKKSAPPPDPPLPNEQHLSVLTDYVSFMES